MARALQGPAASSVSQVRTTSRAASVSVKVLVTSTPDETSATYRTWALSGLPDPSSRHTLTTSSPVALIRRDTPATIERSRRRTVT